MKAIVKSPLSLNHYDFMKKFLEDAMKPHLSTLENKKASEKEREQALAALNKTLNNALAALRAKKDADENLQANIQKLTNILDTFSTIEKKKHYDEALTNPAVTQEGEQLRIKYGKKTITLISLVPLDTIQSEFSTFIEEQRKAWDASKGPFPEKSFKSERLPGPPPVLVLTFPDEASAKAFIERLFSKNMAMFPDGSQDINDLDKQLAAQEKEEVTPEPTQGFRKKMAEVREDAAPGLTSLPGMTPGGINSQKD